MEDTNFSILEAFDKAAGSKCFSGANTTPVLKGKGKDDKSPFTLNEVLREFIKTDVEIHFIRDGDGLDDKWRGELSRFATNHNVILHQLLRHEIENYILEPQLIHRVLVNKYPDKKVPSEAEIAQKLCEFLSQTILMARYRYDANLQDSIYKTAMLLNKQDYRNPLVSTSEAIRIREVYEKQFDIDQLVVTGMGKEALASLMKWINEDLALKLSHAELLSSIALEDVPSEIYNILEQLKSKEAKESPVSMPIVEIQEEAQTDEEEIRVLVPQQLEFKLDNPFEFLDYKNPKNKVEQFAVIARFRELKEGATASMCDDFEAMLKACHISFEREKFSDDMKHGKEAGLFSINGNMADGFILSPFGQQYVDLLPDRDAIKALKKSKPNKPKKSKKQTAKEL